MFMGSRPASASNFPSRENTATSGRGKPARENTAESQGRQKSSGSQAVSERQRTDHHHHIGGWRPEDHDHHHHLGKASEAASSAAAEARKLSPLKRGEAAPRMQLQAHRPTPASSMVQPWSPADMPEASGHDEHIRLLHKAKMDKHDREMDRHIEEHLHGSYQRRKNMRQGLSWNMGNVATWPAHLEDAVRETSLALRQVVGCCSRTASGGSCSGTSAYAEDVGGLPGVNREY